MRASGFHLTLLSILFTTAVFAGTTGKIVGTVADARTGEPLPSVNITIEKTNLGASTNVEGYYVILNVPPGRYRITARLLGYRTQSFTDVRVDIDQTTTQNIQLSEEAIRGEEVTVVASRPVVQRDVAASRANIEIADVEKLPVTTVTAAVGLEAGVQGLSIRGGSADQTAFVMDGMTMRDERTNNPYTGIPLSAVQDIQLTTGGFSAEYGNLRSGIINVVTKEGSASAYSFTFTSRYASTAPKHFGPTPHDPKAYWIRPYLDDAVCWTGTDNGAWDEWTQKQYTPFLGGYNAIAAKSLQDTIPSNDLTPQAAKDLFLYEHRKIAEVQQPDFDFDAGFGGPVPFLSRFGNLRFFAAYRQSSSAYIIPLSRSAYREANGQVRVTADLSGTMKLTGSFLRAKITGTSSNNSGLPGMFSSASSVASALSQVSYIDTRIFATDYWAPTKIDYWMGGLKLSRMISPATYYDATLTYFRSEYSTNPGSPRDTRTIYQFGNLLVDEAPWGFDPDPQIPSSPVSTIRYGLGFSNTRDTSAMASLTGKFDLSSQIDRYNQIKVGAEIAYSDNNGRYAQYDLGLPRGNTFSSWHTFPWRIEAYIKDKLEFEGMVADIGVRFQSLDPNGYWYEVANPWDPAFSGAQSAGIDTLLPKSKTRLVTSVSPRLGISFPISEDAKLFFNYGHARQLPVPDNLFLLRRSSYDNMVSRLADPSAPFPKTIQYEVGYEHSLFDEYLLRVSAYYKDVTEEARTVQYVSRDRSVNYGLYTTNGYSDSRGIEFTARKNRGNWVQGFINYTYRVTTAGYFGYAVQYQSPSEQADYNRNNVYQEKPVPQPFARLNLDLFTPRELGPEFIGVSLLGDWRVNFLASWSSGFFFTWTGGGARPDVLNNLQWQDFWNVDMRLSKMFQFRRFGLQLFADISNLLNYKYMTQSGFVDDQDYLDYVKSLHLPAKVEKDLGYTNVAGDDTPGDYRNPGVPYQPVVPLTTAADLALAQYHKTRPWYYVKETGQYLYWNGSAHVPVDQGTLSKALDDKAYIDMPNQETFTFLNPRRVFWGVRLTYDF